MKTKYRKMLPKTFREIPNGGVYVQRVRCGKPNCRCVYGETHTAFYFFTRQFGKLIKTYIRKSEVKAFSSVAAQAAENREFIRENKRASVALLKQMRQLLRERNLFIRSLKGV